jgi:hypothetical protein
MLKMPEIESLRKQLASALGSIEFGDHPFGQPHLVEKAAAESEKLFQGYAMKKPSDEDAYAAALAFMRGRTLDDVQRHLVAGALNVAIREQGNARVLGHKHLSSLLADYETEANAGDLWRLTWYGLLGSYFLYDPLRATTEEQAGWAALRELLAKTWPLVDRQAGSGVVPDWLKLLRSETQLLTDRPADKYGRDYLDGRTEVTEKLASDLDIPPTSWFWHALVLGAVRIATSASDDAFRELIPKLLRLLEGHPVFRDEAVEAILIRYEKIPAAPVHERLRDYVISKEVWRNPKLKEAGIATKWNRVPEKVWRMVLTWVNEGNLRDFFDILAARNKADEGRLAFWSQYLKQITWTRLVFGQETMTLARQQPKIRALIAREEGAYATLTVNKGVDAFMMQIGEFIVVEFSKAPNACYVYRASEMKFDRYQTSYEGSTYDLRYGFHYGSAARITHFPGWEQDAQSKLSRLGIKPDALAKPKRVSADGNRDSRDAKKAPQSAKFTMAELEELTSQYKSVRIFDERTASGGRLWVHDSNDSAVARDALRSIGFRWSTARGAWYFPET